jgi:hypothetical protein
MHIIKSNSSKAFFTFGLPDLRSFGLQNAFGLQNHFPVLLLYYKQALGAQASVVIFADVLGFVKGELYGTALALGVGVSLAFKGCVAALTSYYFVF